MNTQISIVCPPMGQINNRIAVIKSIRTITGLGLKEAKDATETTERQFLTITKEYSSNFAALDAELRIIRLNNIEVNGTVYVILDDLRKLAAQALSMGEDELANEILQLVLAEKLRRNS